MPKHSLKLLESETEKEKINSKRKTESKYKQLFIN